MKLEYKPVIKDSLSSIYIKRTNRPYVKGNWHFHKEYELIYFIEGHGTRIVGDHISNFRKGELVLVGEWLPHLWLNEVNAESNELADFIVLKFVRDLGGVNLFSLPELLPLQSLLQGASQGILFNQSVVPRIHDLLLEITQSTHTDKLIYFLQVLKILANEENYHLLSSANFAIHAQRNGGNRLKKVIDFISENYSRSLRLEEVAQLAYMTPQAFCRFFKNRTNKTFSSFLNEVRVSKACQLLINGETSIKHICYEVGFNSLTNFNRTFKNYKGQSPRNYRAKYQTLRLAAAAES